MFESARTLEAVRNRGRYRGAGGHSRRTPIVVLCTVILTALQTATVVHGQSSSLYADPEAAGHTPVLRDGVLDRLSPAIAEKSLVAVRLPTPRRYEVNDLVTIIVRESVEADAKASLGTEKEYELTGEITEFPNIRPEQLLQFQLRGDNLAGREPKVDVRLENQFEGDGDYSRSDSFTTRITARIIDIKPNGTFILEARKFIRTDDESVHIVLTGTCRKEDVTASNTVLSTQMYDLRLEKEHKGELRRATKKGWISKFFDGLFNF